MMYWLNMHAMLILLQHMTYHPCCAFTARRVLCIIKYWFSSGLDPEQQEAPFQFKHMHVSELDAQVQHVLEFVMYQYDMLAARDGLQQAWVYIVLSAACVARLMPGSIPDGIGLLGSLMASMSLS